MPVTLTIKNVADDLADRLRERAADRRRSLQRELLLILEQTAALGAAEPIPGEDRASGSARAMYKVRSAQSPGGHARSRRGSGLTSTPAGKLSLEELWRRARRLGAPGLLRYEVARVCTTRLIRNPACAKEVHARYRPLDRLAAAYDSATAELPGARG